MATGQNRDDFSNAVKETVARRASYICSNPDCRCLTLCPSDATGTKAIYTGKVAHITAASPNGPRHDASLTGAERSSVDNGIFLCSNCADMIDKNKGQDFPVHMLRKWKAQHKAWVRINMNKSPWSPISVISGEHHAKGKGRVTGIDAQEAVLFTPGTKVTAEGEGEVTATRISSRGGRGK